MTLEIHAFANIIMQSMFRKLHFQNIFIIAWCNPEMWLVKSGGPGLEKN